jgi:hypothetical protein
MKYILILFLIALVSSSEIIHKFDEIKEFSEYEEAELQLIFGIIPYIEKIATAGIALCASARNFLIGTKIIKFIKNLIRVPKIYKGINRLMTKKITLIENLRIFTFGKKIFDKGRAFYNKYKEMIRSPRLDLRTLRVIDKVNISKINQTYQKMKDTYNKAKNIYEKIKDFYKYFQDFYNRYYKKDKTPEEQRQEYQEQEKYRIQAYQAQQQRLKLLEKKRQERLIQQKSQAFQHYVQLRNNNTMTLDTKKVEINNHLNYMLNKGFITPAQKEQMSYIQPPEIRK